MNKEMFLKKFGKNVKLERIKKDLTQEQLAEKMDVSNNYISGIENGRSNMSLGKILELADYIGTDVQNLLIFND